jgi:hypothetical protein
MVLASAGLADLIKVRVLVREASPPSGWKRSGSYSVRSSVEWRS